MLVECDDGGDGGEAQLEAGAGDGFGPEEKDDERAHRDEAKGDGLAPEGDADQDQDGGDAGADGGHLGAGEYRVGDAGEGTGARRDAGKAEAAGARGAPRTQVPGQTHHGTDDGGGAEAADGQEM